MDLLDSLRRAVRHYPGGTDAVAARLGKSPSTLEKELRGAPQYKMGAVDAAESAAMCVELGSAHGVEYPTRVAEAVGGMLVLLPRDGNVRSASARDVALLMRECAEVVMAVANVEADGRITRRELEDLERQWADVVGAGQVLLRNMRARHDADVLSHRAAVEGAR